ncbi:GntR family transcriptional regulator, partial [Bacillus thuringiensis]|nr:GntR family transcriptional regulator [Bacillus thuringiensis]
MSIIPFCEAADPFVNKPTIALAEGAVDCHAHVFS